VPAAQAYCLHADCHQCLDDLQHVFATCPGVAPAAAWVCSLFGAVSGAAPPPVDPRVLLADDQSVWRPGRPTLQHLWTNLRVAFLHAVWVHYCRRRLASQPYTAAAICGQVVAALKAAIWRDWKRARLDLTRLDGTYAAWFRGRDPSLDVAEFSSRWAFRRVLCEVVEDADGSSLRVLLTLAHPVVAPAVAPPPAPSSPLLPPPEPPPPGADSPAPMDVAP
jgi:hypothetical protein